MKKKMMISTIMGLLMFMSVGNEKALATENISYESGIYEVENDVYHEQEIGMVMSRNFLEATMKVEVRKNSVTYYLSFIPSEYMEDYRMKLNDEFVSVEVTEASDETGSVTVKVETDKVDSNMEAVIYVDPMGRDVAFSVIPLLETMTLIETIEENSVNFVYIGIGVLIIVGAGYAVKRKKKSE